MANNKQIVENTSKKLFYFFQGTFLGSLISVAPVALIHHKHLNSYIQSLNWPILVFFALSVIIGGILAFLLPSWLNKKTLLIITYLFLYIACCALCQKTNLTFFANNLYQNPPNYSNLWAPLLEIPGLLLLSAAAIQFVKTAIRKNKHPHIDDKNIRHSLNLNWLLYMAGISLIFCVWFPLLALPGAWIITRWFD